MRSRNDNPRTIKAADLTVGSVIRDVLENRVVKDVSTTRHSVVVKLEGENLFSLYPRRDAAGVFKSFRKAEDVVVIDCYALRMENEARREYAKNQKGT